MTRVLVAGVAALLALGCGRLGFDARASGDGSPGDGDGSDGPPLDAAPPGAACMHAPVTGPAIYVSPSGTDSNAGTSASPVATVTRAHALAANNSTIVVRAGTYANEPGNEISIDKTNIRLISEQPYAARVPRISCDACNGLTVEQFEITGSSVSCMQVSFGLNVTIRDNIIHGCAQAGVRIAGDVTGTLVESNVIYDSVNALVHVNQNSNVNVRDNVIFESTPGGTFPMIWLEGIVSSTFSGNVVFNGRRDTMQYGNVALGDVSNVVIENNLFGPHQAAATIDGAIGLDDSSGTASIRFNTFRGPFNGVAFGTSRKGGLMGGATFTITHNIFVSPTNTTQLFSDSTSASPDGFVLDRNLYWNPPSGAFVETASSLGPGDDTRALVMDPAVVAAGAQTPPVWMPGSQMFAGGSTNACDLRTRLITALAVVPSSSPAVGRSLAPPPAFDIRGNARPAAATLGAFEP
ncbi:MAG: right-handed parallel beta-helix repeat-containing protein [Deltaproteobacteria bacterium]|nr:right-handed parallel beta-helix repeat-containing protein [Deltaproteobacteria bacterium]